HTHHSPRLIRPYTRLEPPPKMHSGKQEFWGLRSYVSRLLRDRPGVAHQREEELSALLGHGYMPRMLEPDEMFLRRFHRLEPRGSNLCIHVLVMAALKEDQRN